MTILPGGCCYGNASATAMIAHSCLINWFFNAPWYVRTLQVHWIWENNGFSSASPFFWPSLVSLVISLQLFPHVLWSALMFLTEWGRIQLGYLKCKRIFFFFFRTAFCEQLLRRTQSLMPCEYYAFSKQPCCRITLLCIFIPAIYWDQLWLESQAFISEPPLVFIKTSYARACSIWSF